MTERIDHATESARLLEWSVQASAAAADRILTPNEAHSIEGALNRAIAKAGVHATLALVEQQRIANLIVVAGWVMDSTKEDVGYDLDKLRVGVAGEIWEGLGL